MHFYPFHISDYAAHTRHLSLVEDAIYRRMLDLYYLREAPLPACKDTVARLTGATEHYQSVEALLAEFFTLTDDGYTSQRADVEIAKYQKRVGDASKAGRASVKRRLNGRSTTVEPPLNDRSTNHEPRTMNQEPVPVPKPAALAVARPVGVEDATWNDWLKHRQKIKAPVTKTAMRQMETEAGKAGISLEEAIRVTMSAGWRGFRADYVSGRDKPKPAEPPRNLGKSALAECVLHDPDSERCMCDRCESDRRRGSGYGERVVPSGAKRPGVSA